KTCCLNGYDLCGTSGAFCCPAGQCCGNTCCGPDEECVGGQCMEVDCFTAETRVAMADGTEKPIARVQAGDHVLGPDGEVYRVTGLHETRLGSRKLYALNGSEFFVTGDHPL